MDILKLDLDVYWPLILPILILLLSGGIIGVVSKSKIINFEKHLAMFKFIFYVLLALGTFLLDVKIEGDSIKSVGFAIPDTLSIGQFLLIVLSTFEAFSNFIDILKVPKSDFHLVTKKMYQADKSADFEKRIQTAKKIAELEKEIAEIKRKTLGESKGDKENKAREELLSKEKSLVRTGIILYCIQQYIVRKRSSTKE